MGVGSDIARGWSTVQGSEPGTALMEEYAQKQDKSKIQRFFDFLNRGTSASASAFNELWFEPTPDPVKAYIDGLMGKGKIQSFTELSKKAGWDPKTPEGKTAQFLLGLGLDVGLDISTYFTLGAAPYAKSLRAGAEALKGGLTASEVTGKFGKEVGIAAKIIKRAEKLDDPRVSTVVNKLLKGEELTRAEEAILDARTVLGLETLGVFGPTGGALKLVPREASVRFYTQASQLKKWLDTAPVISPVIQGFGKAFSSFYDIKKKFPDYFRLRQARDKRLHYATAQGMQRAVSAITELANEEERKVITRLMEEGPEAGVVTGSYFKDITKTVEATPQLWADMGLDPRAKITDEQAVDLLTHWTNEVNDWLDEFGEGGIFDVRELRSQKFRLEQAISDSNIELGVWRKRLDDAKRLAAEPNAAGAEGASRDIELIQRRMEKITKAIPKYQSDLKKAEDQLLHSFGPAVERVDKWDIGRGMFGSVKGKWDTLKFRDLVIKVPNQLNLDSFEHLAAEGKLYHELRGIPGIGDAKVVFKEFPIDETGDRVARTMFEGGVPKDTSDLAEAGYIVTKANGQRVLKVPHVVKRLVDIDDEATKAFHGTGGNKHWRMPTKAIRSFEKLLARASRAGVAMGGDLHPGNLIVDKKGQVHLLDLGYDGAVDKTPEGVRKAWARNLELFTDFVTSNTKFTNDEAKRWLQGLPIRKGSIGPDKPEMMLGVLKSVGLPARYLTEKGATAPAVEGFVQLEKGAPKTFKMHQRELVEERDLLISRLSPQAREAYDNVMMWKRELTEKLLNTGLLTEEWVEQFEKKHGIPHLRHLRTQEGLIKRFVNAMSKGLQKTPGTLKARKIEGTIKDINDRFGREFFETDIAKIMLYSELETASAIENWNLLRMIRDNEVWSRPANEVYRTVPGKAKPVRTFEADEGWKILKHPLFNDGERAYQVPVEIAKDIENVILKSREDIGSGILKKYYDPMHNWLRKYSLFLFPSSLLRNLGGGVWNNFLADIPPSAHLDMHQVLWGGKKIEQAWAEFKAGQPFAIDGIRAAEENRKLRFKIDGRHYTHQEILDEMHEHGVLGHGQFGPQGDIQRDSWESVGSIFPQPNAKDIMRRVLPTGDNTMLQFGMRVQAQIENVLRGAHYMAMRRKGLSAYDAAMSVKKYHFDYQELTDFERNWLKRIFFFPTWTKNNVPLQAKMLLLRPGKFFAAGKTIGAIEEQVGGPEPEDKMLPEWLRKQLNVRIRYNKDTKTYEYFLLSSWLPAADVLRIFNPGEELLNMVSPIPKQVIEQALNKSVFFQEPLEEYPGQRREFLSPEAGKLLAGVPGADALGKILFGAPISEGVTLRGRATNALRSLRVVNEGRRVAESAARGGGNLALINSLIGKSYEVDPQRTRSNADYENKMLLAKLKYEFKKAVRSGKNTEAARILRKIREVQGELSR